MYLCQVCEAIYDEEPEEGICTVCGERAVFKEDNQRYI